MHDNYCFPYFWWSPTLMVMLLQFDIVSVNGASDVSFIDAWFFHFVFPYWSVFNISDISLSCSFETLLYKCTTSKLLCPVSFIISCSSTPAWNSLVAVVTLKEWFNLWPCIPVMEHKRDAVLPNVLCPTGTVEYQTFLFFLVVLRGSLQFTGTDWNCHF